jgi:hypothetical protein
MCLVALSLALVVRLSPADLTLLVTALARQFEPMFVTPGVDMARLDDLARRITRGLPRARHAEMSPHGFAVAAAKGTDGEVLAAGALELANRVGLLASGDVLGAVQALTPQGTEPKAALTSVPMLGRLIRVALSERFAEARHATGADRAGAAG